MGSIYYYIESQYMINYIKELSEEYGFYLLPFKKMNRSKKNNILVTDDENLILSESCIIIYLRKIQEVVTKKDNLIILSSPYKNLPSVIKDLL